MTIGGGELARDEDAEVMEILSTCSLNGVPGVLREVALGLREGILLADAAAGVDAAVAAGADAAVAVGVDAAGAAGVNAAGTAGVELLVAPVLGTGGGISALGVPVIRKVRGCVPERRTGDPDAIAPGVPGREERGDAKEDARVLLATESGIAETGDPVLDDMSFSVCGVALEMSSFPGCGLLPLTSVLPFVESVSGGCSFVAFGSVLCLFPRS